jgi:hypothetical protein
MGIINILIMTLSYCYCFNTGIHPKHINKNIIMKQDDFNFLNNSDKFSNGLKLFTAKTTKDTSIKWLYGTLDEVNLHPTFVISDLVSTISYCLKEPDQYDLYIAYMPNRFDDEPHFMGCFSIKPDKRVLSIEQICTNPFIKDSSLTDYKKKLTNLAKQSGVVLYPQPLKYLINPRYYIEFTQSL